MANLYLSDLIEPHLASVLAPLQEGDGKIDSFLLEDEGRSRQRVSIEEVGYFENMCRWDSRQGTAVSE